MDLVKPGLVSFEVSRNTLAGAQDNVFFFFFSQFLDFFKSQINFVQFTLKSPALTGPSPYALGFILWSLHPGVPAAAAKAAASILGISALGSQLLCEVAALQFESCVCKGNLSNNNIEREEKKEEKGLYITELTELLQ